MRTKLGSRIRDRELLAAYTDPSAGAKFTIQDAKQLVTKKIRPPDLSTANTYPLAATVSPVIILE